MKEHMEGHIERSVKAKYSIKDFLPLIVIFAVIFAFSFYSYYSSGFDVTLAMRMFMGGFFIIFGALKVTKLKAFAEAYQMYDLVAAKSLAYAYFYPFIELALGVAYFMNYELVITNWVTLVIMLVGAFGVYLKLRKNEEIMCACLGTVFKVPMTWVTLFEDLLMAGMAILMLMNI